eukprot:TRINITY_DN24595_c0_g1_i1.p1 TRINITY_DN24595_c0_g1~~TRINITY_DN24595_c0_g1_i1.p1  ORF type:complete len:135 (-),score=19.19 TRINITY_DN24595_c0_g1_i1:110-490(-)
MLGLVADYESSDEDPQTQPKSLKRPNEEGGDGRAPKKLKEDAGLGKVASASPMDDLCLPSTFGTTPGRGEPREAMSVPVRVLPPSTPITSPPTNTPPKKKSSMIPPQLRGRTNVVTEDYSSWSLKK